MCYVGGATSCSATELPPKKKDKKLFNSPIGKIRLSEQ